MDKKIPCDTKQSNIAPQKTITKNAHKEIGTSVWDRAKIYAKGFKEGFFEYYAEKYKGTEGIKDALSRTTNILDESGKIYKNNSLGLVFCSKSLDKAFNMLDKCNATTYIKKPIKKWSTNVAENLSDGNPNNLSSAERSWAVVEGIGSVADFLTSSKGSITACAATAASVVIATTASTSVTATATLKVGSTVAGEVIGTTLVGKGGYDIATAKTESEAKKGGAEICSGTIALIGAAASAKDSLSAAQAAGIETKNPYTLSTPDAMIENIRIFPKVIATESKDITNATKILVTRFTNKSTSKVIKAGSPELQDAIPYMSKANDVQAYRFNPNGTAKEVLSNNPGVYMKDGKYFIPNKWDANNPYLIDTSKEQMIMLYGGDDMAVCDGVVFKGSYVDTAKFKSTGTLNYQTPSQLKYGDIVNVTKQAPGAFKEMPVGTQVETLEGLRTVGQGEVVAIDHAGNPYVTPLKNITKRNIPIDTPVSKDAFARVQYMLDNNQL